jgi:hypothetical protein
MGGGIGLGVLDQQFIDSQFQSWAVSCYLDGTVSIICNNQILVMGTKMVSEMLVIFNQLT